MSSRLLVTAPPITTANPDLAHFLGPRLAADIFVRFQRMRGKNVAFLTGASNPRDVAREPNAFANSPEQTREMFSSPIASLLQLASIEPDLFISPSSPSYPNFVGSFFRRLWESGCLRSKVSPAFHCPSCSRNLGAEDVVGRCGRCGYVGEGPACEACSEPMLPHSVENADCAICGSHLNIRSLQQLIFPLNQYAGVLRKFHQQPRMSRRAEERTMRMLAVGLPDVPVGYPGGRGTPMALPGSEEHVVAVLAETAAAYLATTQELGVQGHSSSWSDDSSEIVQFIAFEDIFAHTLLYPALLFAHGDLRPADAFMPTYFYARHGTQASLGHKSVVSKELLSQLPSDHVRYFLCFNFGEDRVQKFTAERFQQEVNRNLARIINSSIDSVYLALSRQAETHPPALYAELASKETAGAWDSIDPLPRAIRAANEMGRALELENFSPPRAAVVWREMAVGIGRLSQRSPHLQGVARSNRNQSYWLEKASVALTVLAACAYPLMPEFALRLWRALGIESDLRTHPWGEPVFVSKNSFYAPQRRPWFSEIPDSQLFDHHETATL